MDQKLFREIENICGREKRSTFIEHLIQTGLREYTNKKEEMAAKDGKIAICSFVRSFRRDGSPV
jgi:metal-responsive CopG/Arc/MetJ family transcriptional regulator